MLSNSWDFREFMKSCVSTDMKRELMMWKKGVKQEYAEVETLLEKGRIDGRLEAIDYILQLPKVMMESLEIAEKEKGGADGRE